MPDDGWTTSEPSPSRRKPFPRWLIPVFIADAILIAAVLYYVFGRSDESEPGDTTPPAGQVRGGMIETPPHEDVIPAEVRPWSGRKVAIAGYVQPPRVNDNRVSPFWLTPNQT